jgi:hypothetical protein
MLSNDGSSNGNANGDSNGNKDDGNDKGDGNGEGNANGNGKGDSNGSGKIDCYLYCLMDGAFTVSQLVVSCKPPPAVATLGNGWLSHPLKQQQHHHQLTNCSTILKMFVSRQLGLIFTYLQYLLDQF